MVPLRLAARALSVPNFRLYWASQLVSLLGTWMQTVALSWLVLEVTDSPLALGTLIACQFAPYPLFSLYGGVLADRIPKHRLLIYTQLIMLAQALGLAALTLVPHPPIWLLYVLAAVFGVAEAVDNPTQQAFVQELVGPENLPNAIALNSTQFTIARIVGPGIGGVLVAAFGARTVFLINAVSFLVVIAALTRLRVDQLQEPRRRDPGSAWEQIKAGISYGVHAPQTAGVLLLAFVLGTFGYNFVAILSMVAKYVLDAGPAGYGGITSAVGVGSLLASLTLAALGRESRLVLIMGAGAFSLCILGLGLSHSDAVTIAILLVWGFADILFFAGANTQLQLDTPPEMRGRLMSLYMLGMNGTTPIGSLLLGFLASHYNPRVAISAMGAICLVGVLAAAGLALRTGVLVRPAVPQWLDFHSWLPRHRH
ncbi:MAG: MFS transporter [Candidatus Eremiobacterota bacterium]